VGDVLSRAGFVNVVPASAGDWPRVSLETLAAWKPDIVIRPETKENEEAFAALPRDPRWRLLPAVREGRILRVPGALGSPAAAWTRSDLIAARGPGGRSVDNGAVSRRDR
jgi:ABC-type Fe3+-hydroxamate transport system substrate-binding protein